MVKIRLKVKNGGPEDSRLSRWFSERISEDPTKRPKLLLFSSDTMMSGESIAELEIVGHWMNSTGKGLTISTEDPNTMDLLGEERVAKLLRGQKG